MIKKPIIIMAVLLFLGINYAFAEDGGPVILYPDAKSDKATSKFCEIFNKGSQRQMKNPQKQSPGIEASCYRTRDGFAKVVGFFNKQPKLEKVGGDDKGAVKTAMFCLKGKKCATTGEGINVNIQTPWTEGTNTMKDTLITIMKNTKK